MLLRDMFKKTTYITVERTEKQKNSFGRKQNIPEGLWTKCEKCGEMIYTEDLEENDYICTKCGHYFRLNVKRRLKLVLDEGSFEEWDIGIKNENPLSFPKYEEKISSLKKKTELDEAVVTGKGKINGRDVVIGICDTSFMMGSMGKIVGEKVTRAIEKATDLKLPIILFTCSGGARMQEGIVSLMQMAKTAAAVKKHSDAGLLYITVLTDPTTGGVTASFAMLGDIILAEPGALVGFAGPRVIKQTIGQDLPEGFQRSEFLLEHGFVDNIVIRKNLKRVLTRILRIHTKYSNETIEESFKEILEEVPKQQEYNSSSAIDAWDKVRASRMSNRPTSRDYMKEMFKHFYELHGDRVYGEDGAIIGGIAMFGKQPVTVIGQQKGRNTKENIVRNFGMPSPDGYRKALRLMKQAEKFHRPIICFVDTPGAFCGIEAEERGQGEAIARNLMEISGIKTPILSVMIGEGGSGGALAMAVANEVWMLENATYSVLSPEGFATILWRDSKRASEAANIMKITAKDLKDLDVIDKVIPENGIVTVESIIDVTSVLKRSIVEFFRTYGKKNEEELTEQRYQRYRRM